MKLGERLRELRENRGLSTQALSKLSNIDRSTLSRYETGDRELDSLKHITALSKALDVPLNYFLDLEVDHSNATTDNNNQNMTIQKEAISNLLLKSIVLTSTKNISNTPVPTTGEINLNFVNVLTLVDHLTSVYKLTIDKLEAHQIDNKGLREILTILLLLSQDDKDAQDLITKTYKRIFENNPQLVKSVTAELSMD